MTVVGVGQPTTGAADLGATRRRDDLVAGAGLLLLCALSVGAFAQGGFYGAARHLVVVLLAAAVVLALAARPPRLPELRAAGLVWALGLAGWSLVRGAVTTEPRSGLGPAGLALGVAAVVIVVRRQSAAGRRTVLSGLVAIGVLVAASGWLGVVTHREPWGLVNDGVWRGASTLTYANATAALLVPLSLVSLALLTRRAGDVRLALVASVLLLGVAATLSRAGLLSLAVGGVVLAALGGPRRTARAALAPVLGAAVAAVGLVPEMPLDSAPAWPAPVLALGAGLGITAVLTRRPPRRRQVVAGAVLVVLTAAALAVGPLSGALSDVARFRASVTSPARSDAAVAAVQLVADHPVAGVGPADGWVRWNDAAGATLFMRYVHDEYLQTAVELGLVGLALLAGLVMGAGRLIRRALRTVRPLAVGVAAGGSALLVHSAFDFVWHVPVVPLTAAALLGLLTEPVLDIRSSHSTRAVTAVTGFPRGGTS